MYFLSESYREWNVTYQSHEIEKGDICAGKKKVCATVRLMRTWGSIWAPPVLRYSRERESGLNDVNVAKRCVCGDKTKWASRMFIILLLYRHRRRAQYYNRGGFLHPTLILSFIAYLYAHFLSHISALLIIINDFLRNFSSWWEKKYIIYSRDSMFTDKNWKFRKYTHTRIHKENETSQSRKKVELIFAQRCTEKSIVFPSTCKSLITFFFLTKVIIKTKIDIYMMIINSRFLLDKQFPSLSHRVQRYLHRIYMYSSLELVITQNFSLPLYKS